MKHCRILLAICVLVMMGAALIVFSPGKAQEVNRVGLVVQYLDGSIENHCVEVGNGEIKGSDVLIQSELEIQFEFNASAGLAVCKIEQDGCSSENCFCDMPNYWSYWHLQPDTNNQWRWMYSQLGASNYVVTPGQVEGWRYGPGQPPSQMPGFDEICTTPMLTNTLSPTVSPTPTNIPSPTVSPTPEQTATSTRRPTRTPEPILPCSDSWCEDSNLVSGQSTATVTYAAPSETPTPSETCTATPSATATYTPTPSSTQSPTPTFSPSPTPDTHTPLPNTNEAVQVLAQVSSILTPTEVLAATETPTPIPTKKPLPDKKPSTVTAVPLSQEPPPQPEQQTPTLPVIQPESSSGMKTTGNAAEQPPDPAPRDNAWKRLALLTGGLAGILTFLFFFGVLSAALVVVLVQKRR